MSTALYGGPSSKASSDSDEDGVSESENQSMLSNSGVNTNHLFNSRQISSKDTSSLNSDGKTGAIALRHKKLD